MRNITRVAIVIFFNYSSLSAQTLQSAFENQYKADLICKLAQFIEWPENYSCWRNSDNANVSVCIFGTDPFEAIFGHNAACETSSADRVTVFRDNQLATLKCCNLLFISRSEDWRLSTVLRAAEKIPMLTVSDIEGFRRRGGMIEFFSKGADVKIAINKEAAERQGIRISSKLLQLSDRVNDEVESPNY
ncbi:MAG: hypothetical protein DCC75_04125 [Proteobacteria bacterium]|nr:MAG: hypothetical protein DCC75_04125 [Pseudomonadota bacterium]